ncbi:unnamed protein product, partial [Gordionus sp. m RMFG-2023]
MSIIYLYQGKQFSDSSKLSSSIHGPLNRFPLVEARTFIFPLHSDITSLTTTFTELGLTQKKIIMALADGKLYQFGREILDQKFSYQKTKISKKVIFYVPELPYFTQQVMNYNRSLFRIKGFYVSPSGLESTSLVFAYGL